jgi:hypothetical protein
MIELSERRQADRKQMAEILTTIAQEHGATVEKELEGSNSRTPRRIVLRISTESGVRVVVEFDGRGCQPDVHVITWQSGFTTENPKFFSAEFADSATSVRDLFPTKETSVCCGFDILCQDIQGGLILVRDGRALDPTLAVAYKAKLKRKGFPWQRAGIEPLFPVSGKQTAKDSGKKYRREYLAKFPEALIATDRWREVAPADRSRIACDRSHLCG